MHQTRPHPPVLKNKNSNGLREQLYHNTLILGDQNTLLSPTDRSSWQKINKEISELLPTSNQIDIVDIYRVFHATTRQYTFFMKLMELSPKEIF
jgi:exonuclease III